MEYTSAMVVIFAMVVGCIAYGLTLLANGKSAERKTNHEEFKSRLPLSHEEDLLKIAANRDVEIAKATKKEPMKTIEGSRHEDSL